MDEIIESGDLVRVPFIVPDTKIIAYVLGVVNTPNYNDVSVNLTGGHLGRTVNVPYESIEVL